MNLGAYYLAAQECEAVARELLAQQVIFTFNNVRVIFAIFVDRFVVETKKDETICCISILQLPFQKLSFLIFNRRSYELTEWRRLACCRSPVWCNACKQKGPPS